MCVCVYLFMGLIIAKYTMLARERRRQCKPRSEAGSCKKGTVSQVFVMLRKVIDIIDVSSFFLFPSNLFQKGRPGVWELSPLVSTSSYFTPPSNISFVTLAFYVLLVSYCVSTQELTSPLQFSFSVHSTVVIYSETGHLSVSPFLLFPPFPPAINKRSFDKLSCMCG